jgi:hypothetical protein
MNRIVIALFLFVSAVLSSCTTSKSVVSKNVDLSKYEYASVINNNTYHIPAQLMQYEIQLFDAVENSRLKLVSDMRIENLTPSQQSKLLIVKYGVDVLEDETVVIVNFIDYLSGRPVVSCRGAYTAIVGVSNEINGAIKRVSEQISQTFPK